MTDGDGKEARPARPRQDNTWLVRLSIASGVAFVLAVGLGYWGLQLRSKQSTTASKLKQASEIATACEGKLELAKAESAQLGGKLTACSNKARATDHKQKRLEASMATMSENLNATRAELDELRKKRAETAKRLAAFKELTAKFRKMIDKGKLNVIVRNGRMMVKLPAGVLFAPGNAELSRDGELAVMEVAIVLRQLKKRKFMVAGHTDNRPLESSSAKKTLYRNNWELSTARAVTVTKFLIETKMNPTNLVAAGYSQFDPVGDNKTARGRQENRRIEIVLLPNIEELPIVPTE